MYTVMPRRVPVILPPVAGELLSSWISRHANFYEVPPLIMLRHCIPETASQRSADLHLSNDQEIRLTNMFTTDPVIVRRMTFTKVEEASRRLIAARATRTCKNCGKVSVESAPILRSQFLGWWITCTLCGHQLRDADGRDLPSLFRQYRRATLRGEKEA